MSDKTKTVKLTNEEIWTVIQAVSNLSRDTQGRIETEMLYNDPANSNKIALEYNINRVADCESILNKMIEAKKLP